MCGRYARIQRCCTKNKIQIETNYESKGKTIEGKKIRVRSLVLNTLGVKGHVGVPEWD
jgi:hypothetical protein